MKSCIIDNCNNEVFAKRLCRKHYMEQRRKDNPLECTVVNCNKPVKAKGLCGRHYKQYSEQGRIVMTRQDNNNITIDNENGDIAYIDIYNPKGEVIKKAIIDTEDIEKIKNIKWKSSGYGNLYNAKQSITLCELLLGKCEKGYIVAHKNNDLLDCRKSNLVITKTNRRNNRFKHNTSGRKGVYKLNRNGKFTGDYLVYITVNQKSKYLGKRSDFDEAVKLREQAEKEFGWLD